MAAIKSRGMFVEINQTAMNQTSQITTEAKALAAQYFGTCPNASVFTFIDSKTQDADIRNQFLTVVEYFRFDVKFGQHPRYGKNASWSNYKHPDTKVGEMGPETFWYMYETAYTHYDVKCGLSEMFGPKVYESVPEAQTFEQAVFNYWIK